MSEKADAPLDDLMMAMDVVDTLRHDEALVTRELNADNRGERMMERLREIYASQGIEVPDHILEAGVEGLKQDRFVYSPPSAGFSRSLAVLYVTRLTWSKWLGALVLACVILFAGWQFLVVGPRERAAEALKIELAEGIPASLANLKDRIVQMKPAASVVSDAERLVSTGLAAAQDGNAETARKAVTDLRSLARELAAVFDVKIVSRPGVPTGVERIPDANPNNRNYYIVVEAIGPDGKALAREITSEEDSAQKKVTMWAQRVPSATFEKVRRDKQDDGIVQNNLLGSKVRGKLAIDWRQPVGKGAITSW